ncbi:MAG: Eco57I restriction-modification methylase domain-containing protein, partial [Dysgonamonadaceae bacterium]|nr:Eco57I restriction-modification methylase domain-containing protein [Dysgonamonadaceae bacterium]
MKSPKQALNPAFLKKNPERKEIELFKKEFITLIDRINPEESEEFHKNLIKDFLNAVYYKDKHYINTKGHSDLVIHNNNDTASSVGVLIEAKSPANKGEMVSHNNLDAKSFQELALYYLRERKTGKNFELRYLIITNIYEWFVFDAQDFEKLFYQNKNLLNHFEQFQTGKLSGTSTDFFYKEIASPEIRKIQTEIPYTYFDIRDYEQILRNADKEDDRKLIALYKFLSPVHLLKLPFAEESNQLNREFYAELLHIIGLEEIKQDNRKLIVRKKENERDGGSMIENAITAIDSMDKLDNIDSEQYGENKQECLFNVAFDLAISWINRILFLKLLEAQIIKYHNGNNDFAFLSVNKLNDYGELNSLFFSVLACKEDEREESIKTKFAHLPYLNSSLFEKTDMENKTIFINNLQDNIKIKPYSRTVLHDTAPTMRPLEYLLRFLDAYDFSSEDSEEIREEDKTLISASVLGLIFEKINGYRDGSFFTPSLITMYMCRETLSRAVIQKFNETKSWNCLTVNDLYNKIDDIAEANEIFNSIRICDPAVGSGHFLVSSLNEMIYLKSELGILADKNGRKLRDYRVSVEHDELIITDNENNHFVYNPKNRESQRVQETFFHEKQLIIENCLFGVDINPNSVKICQLRLWIELLKHTYYRSATNELETLPNIDINIKCGNSLLSRFDLRDKYTGTPGLEAKVKKNTRQYKEQTSRYKSTSNKESRRQILRIIDETKAFFLRLNDVNDRDYIALREAQSKLLEQTQTGSLSVFQTEEWQQKNEELTAKVVELDEKYKEKVKSCFEWRYEFPEVLDEDGNFIGFDVIIGNPPYIQLQSMGSVANVYKNMNYQVFERTGDIYCLFYERGYRLLKPQGRLCFITSNKWMRAGYGENTRKFFVENTNPELLID